MSRENWFDEYPYPTGPEVYIKPKWMSVLEWLVVGLGLGCVIALVAGTYAFVVLPLEWWTGRKGRA